MEDHTEKQDLVMFLPEHYVTELLHRNLCNGVPYAADSKQNPKGHHDCMM